MNSFKNFHFVFASVFVLAALVETIHGKCQSVEELDDCAFKSAFLINRNIKIPATVEEAKRYCQVGKESYKCLKDFSQECVTGPPKQLLNKVFGIMEKSMKDRCQDDGHIQEFIDNLKCLDSDDKIERIRKCSDKHILMLEQVSNLKLEQKAGPLCCTFHAFKNCIVSNFKEICGDDALDYFKNMVTEHSEELATITCSQFNDMDKCAANLPADVWASLKPIVEADLNGEFKHNYKTSIPILYGMIEKYIKKSK